MNRVFAVLLLVVSAISFSPFSFAQNSVVLRCDGCTEAQKKSAAQSWGYPNFTLAEAQAKVKKLSHITDFTNNTIVTYELSLSVVYLRPNQPPQTTLVITPIATPADINYKFQDVVSAVRSMKSSVENSVVIPTMVIKNAWEFVNCAYCENHVHDYLNQQVAGKIETAARTVEALSLSLGLLQPPLPNVYKILLQSGGFLYIEVKITGDVELYIKVVEIVDVNGNKVPTAASALNNMRIFVGNTARTAEINAYINSFNFAIPPNKAGYVIIVSCDGVKLGDPLDVACLR